MPSLLLHRLTQTHADYDPWQANVSYETDSTATTTAVTPKSASFGKQASQSIANSVGRRDTLSEETVTAGVSSVAGAGGYETSAGASAGAKEGGMEPPLLKDSGPRQHHLDLPMAPAVSIMGNVKTATNSELSPIYNSEFSSFHHLQVLNSALCMHTTPSLTLAYLHICRILRMWIPVVLVPERVLPSTPPPQASVGRGCCRRSCATTPTPGSPAEQTREALNLTSL